MGNAGLIVTFFSALCALSRVSGQVNYAAVADENIITAHLAVTLGITSIGNETFDATDAALQDPASDIFKQTSATISNSVASVFQSQSAKDLLGDVIYQAGFVIAFNNASTADENTRLRLELSNGFVNLDDIRDILNVTSLQSRGINVTKVTVADIDECTEMSVCSAYSTCENAIGGFRCTCASGYIDVASSFKNLIGGRYCSQPCAMGSCGGHGKCRVRFDGPILCECYADYSGTDCSQYVGTTTPAPAKLQDWSIIVISVTMGLLAIVLLLSIPFIVYQVRKYKTAQDEEEFLSSGRGRPASAGRTISNYNTLSDASSIAAYQSRLPKPTRQGEFTIPRPLVINPKSLSLHNPYGSKTSI